MEQQRDASCNDATRRLDMGNVLIFARKETMSRRPAIADPLAVELRELERQHRDLFALIYLYSTSTSIKSDSDRRMVRNILMQVVQSAEKHFLAEENVLAKLKTIGKPRIDSHRMEHRRIVGDLLRLIETASKPGEKFQLEREHALDSLIVHHIRDDSELMRDWRKSR